VVQFKDLWRQLLIDHQWHGELWNRRKDGQAILCAVSITAVCDDDGQVTHYVASHVDITLRKAAEDEVRRMAFFDALTQLPNRRLLTDRLQQAVSQARRNSTMLAVMYIELDKFKPVNDNYGHAVGDDLLRMVGQRMSVCVRETDTVARVGGDEFVLLLPDIKQLQDVLKVAEKIHFQLRQPFALTSGVVVNISSSAGIALFPHHGDNEEQLSHSADVAMYMAKAGGRDRFLVFSPEMVAPDASTAVAAIDSNRSSSQESLPT
jgi:diguanylate cyclase (GGDEF)-like protein